MAKNNSNKDPFDFFNLFNNDDYYNDNGNDNDNDNDNDYENPTMKQVISWDNFPLEVKKQIFSQLINGSLQNPQPYSHLSALIPQATPKIISSLAASANQYQFAQDLDDLQLAFLMLEQSQKYLNQLVNTIKEQMYIIQEQCLN